VKRAGSRPAAGMDSRGGDLLASPPNLQDSGTSADNEIEPTVTNTSPLCPKCELAVERHAVLASCVNCVRSSRALALASPDVFTIHETAANESEPQAAMKAARQRLRASTRRFLAR
jgi:hypothetical protein